MAPSVSYFFWSNPCTDPQTLSGVLWISQNSSILFSKLERKWNLPSKPLSASCGPLISPVASFMSVGTLYSPARGKEEPCEEETEGLGGTVKTRGGVLKACQRHSSACVANSVISTEVPTSGREGRAAEKTTTRENHVTWNLKSTRVHGNLSIVFISQVFFSLQGRNVMLCLERGEPSFRGMHCQ